MAFQERSSKIGIQHKSGQFKQHPFESGIQERVRATERTRLLSGLLYFPSSKGHLEESSASPLL